ncbi:hypothetical protein, variant 1, partial [Aphanomyces invadans]
MIPCLLPTIVSDRVRHTVRLCYLPTTQASAEATMARCHREHNIDRLASDFDGFVPWQRCRVLRLESLRNAPRNSSLEAFGGRRTKQIPYASQIGRLFIDTYEEQLSRTRTAITSSTSILQSILTNCQIGQRS